MQTEPGNTWEISLVGLADGLRGQAFQWGETDCAMVVWRTLDVLRPGENHAEIHRGKWKSRKGQLRFIKQHYGLSAYLERLKGARRIERNFQQRGDIIIVGEGFGEEGYVCMGSVALSSWPGRGPGLCRMSEVVARAPLEIWRVR